MPFNPEAVIFIRNEIAGSAGKVNSCPYAFEMFSVKMRLDSF